MDLYKKVEQFVRESFLKANKTESKHAPRTVFWVKELYPKANQALLIAAIAHDIERAFRKHELDGIKNNKEGFLNKKHIKYHQEKGAEIIGDFLKNKE